MACLRLRKLRSECPAIDRFCPKKMMKCWRLTMKRSMTNYMLSKIRKQERANTMKPTTFLLITQYRISYRFSPLLSTPLVIKKTWIVTLSEVQSICPRPPGNRKWWQKCFRLMGPPTKNTETNSRIQKTKRLKPDRSPIYTTWWKTRARERISTVSRVLSWTTRWTSITCQWKERYSTQSLLSTIWANRHPSKLLQMNHLWNN